MKEVPKAPLIKDSPKAPSMKETPKPPEGDYEKIKRKF
jgi:hypothetical protein